MGFYKFLDSKDVGFILNGSLRFGRFQKYRLMELLSGDDWIGDRREGLATTLIKHEFARVGNSTSYGSYNTYVRYFEGYALCFSHGDYDAVRKAMMIDAPYPYDGCVAIADLERLLQAIANGVHPGGRVGDDFGIYYGPCTYEEKPEVCTIEMGEPEEPNPFLKDPKYKAQSEFRILLQPRSRMRMLDDLPVKIVSPAGLFSKMPVEPTNRLAPLRFQMRREDAIAALKAILKEKKVEAEEMTLGERRERLSSAFREAYGSLRFGHDSGSPSLDGFLIMPTVPMSTIFRLVDSLLSDLDRGIKPC